MLTSPFFSLEMHNPDYEKPYVCEICGNSYQRTTGLKQHVMSAHSSQRDYRCQDCGKGFTNKVRLANHLRIHSGAKPFKCVMCGYRSNRRDNVMLHCKKVHKIPAPDVRCVDTIEEELDPAFVKDVDA